MRVHPRFSLRSKYEVGSYWPAKGELYLCNAKDINAFNGAMVIALVKEEDKNDFIDSLALCCYSEKELEKLVKIKVNALLKSPSVKLTYSTVGTSGSIGYPLHIILKDWTFMNIYKGKAKVPYVSYLIVRGVNPYAPFLDWDIECYLKNRVSGNGISIVNKGTLEAALPQYFTKTVPFEETYPKEGGIWMVKTTNVAAFGGVGVHVLSCKEDLPFIIKDLNGDKAIMQQYITDPLLFKGKKFHFRIWLMLTTWDKYYLKPKWHLYHAKLPYVKDQWTNKDIHDTHLKSTDDDYTQEDIKDKLPKDYLKQMDKIAKSIVDICDIKPHDGCKHAYHILGIDIMIAQEKLLLLEVNRSPGRAYKRYDLDLVDQDYQWEWSCVKHLFNT